MISRPVYAIEPWCLRDRALDPDVVVQSESVFTLSNGRICWHGNLDEGQPQALPGTHLDGVHELHSLPYAEAGYEYLGSGQTAINVTNGKIIRLLVDDEPFDLRYGRLLSHERTLDLRSGMLHRVCEWISPVGKTIRVRSTRLVSFTQRAIAAITYEVEPLDAETTFVVQSDLVTNEPLPARTRDPRVAAAIESRLQPEEHMAVGTHIRLVHRTARTNLRVAAAADHVVRGPSSTSISSESSDGVGRLTITTLLKPGQNFHLEKYVAYGWSGSRSLPAVRDQVEAALAYARSIGWQGLADQQRDFLEDFWRHTDIEVESDAEMQQAVRFMLFRVLQSACRTE